MKAIRSRRGAALLAAGLLATFVGALTASAATTYSDYAVFGEHGVFIGGSSEVIGLVGARHDFGPGAGASDQALGMNSGATITGDARIGQDVNMQGNTAITGTLYRVGSLTKAVTATIGTDMPVADADLPAATLASQSQWPGGSQVADCAADHSANNQSPANTSTLVINPGTFYGAIDWGGGHGTLQFSGPGNYFMESLHAANGQKFTVPAGGVNVYVCNSVLLGGNVDVNPVSLLPGQFTWEVWGFAALDGSGNAFEIADGSHWIGNVLVPTAGIHFGGSSGGGTVTWYGYMWADHVDIEHGTVTTKPAKKAGVKWNDINGNGVRDLPDDVGLPGWTIQLRDSTNTSVVASQVTDANGNYEFVDIVPGTYYVCEVQQLNWTETFPNALTQNPSANDVVTSACPVPATYGYLITVVNGDDLNGDDFGNHQTPSPGTKSGVKFDDLNGNGLFDQGEPGIKDWPIRLLDTSNVELDSTTTAADGSYSFTIVDPGTYRVCEGAGPAGYVQTFPNATTPDPSLTDVVISTCPGPNTWGYEFTIAAGQTIGDNDFGNYAEPQKYGRKFNDLNGNGVDDAEPGLPNWPINLLTTANVPVDSTTTAADGSYSFMIAAPAGTYRVCEGSVAGYAQTYPNALTQNPGLTDVVISTCPGPNNWGYEITVDSGDVLRGDDFGNFQLPVCQKAPVQAVLNPVSGYWPGNSGPDYVVRVNHGELVQDAVNRAALASIPGVQGDKNGDGVIIIVVLAHDDGSLGGSAAQSVVISNSYGSGATGLRFGLIGCSVTLTGGGSGAAISITSTANARNTAIADGATANSNIVVMDLHGGSSATGISVVGNGRYLRNENATSNGTGMNVSGNQNTIHNGNAIGNTNDGVVISGDYNLATDTNAMSNGTNGFNVTGKGNQLLKLDLGEKATPNGGDGLHLVGDNNIVQENAAYNNGGDGINVAGNGNQLTKNLAGDKGKANGFVTKLLSAGIRVVGNSNVLTQNTANANLGDGFRVTGNSALLKNTLKNNLSNTTSSGGSLENSGYEYVLGFAITNGGGNKKDNATFSSTAAGSYQ